jgi:hypothetical protein
MHKRESLLYLSSNLAVFLETCAAHPPPSSAEVENE